MTYRSRRLLDLAHEIKACQVQIPGCCIGFSPHGCEPAHGPKSWLHGGGALKSDDVFAAACHACHAEIDREKRLSREERQWYWGRGAARTWAELMRLGWLKVESVGERALRRLA